MNKKQLLKKRIDITCGCKLKNPPKNRARYGTCYCDGYGLCYTLGIVIHNSLIQYVADAKEHIERDDWDVILKHAEAIKRYAEDEVWSMDKKLQKDFEEAMQWLTENWQGLWW